MFGHLDVRKDSLLEEICLLDEAEERGGLSFEERDARQLLKEDSKRVLSMEELWKKKSRV